MLRIERLFAKNDKVIKDINDLYQKLDKVWNLPPNEYFYFENIRICKMGVLDTPELTYASVREVVKTGNIFPFPAEHRKLMTNNGYLLKFVDSRAVDHYCYVFEVLTDGKWGAMPIEKQYALLLYWLEEEK